MRRIQEAALALFGARSFAAVTIDEIAAAADVGPATVYRNFGSKERIVLWDDHDPELFAQVAARLPDQPPGQAVLEGLIAALEPIYARERVRILRRARLVLAVPELRTAAAADLSALEQGFAALFAERKAARPGLEADVFAAAVVGTLQVALAHWVRDRGRTPLAAILRRAFRHLAATAGHR